MLFNNNRSIKKLAVMALLFLLTAWFVTGCQPAATETLSGEQQMDQEMDHEADHEHSDAEQSARVPNEGAIVRLISPADGASFALGEDIVVEVEVESFDLSAEGNHWHLYVDGSTLSMIADGSMKSVVHGLEPGEHKIDVYLGLPTHEELEEGASATITITE